MQQTLLERLETNLGAGYDRIEAARAAGEDVRLWEGFWLDLLRQYEMVYDAMERERQQAKENTDAPQTN